MSVAGEDGGEAMEKHGTNSGSRFKDSDLLRAKNARIRHPGPTRRERIIA